MKKLLLVPMVFCALTLTAQTTLFSDDFESGSGNWTLGGTGSNPWIVNNSYTGVIFTSTPTQPGGITGAPQSNYLHIYNPSMCSGLGDCQAIYLAASGGNMTATMTNNIVTTGFSNVAFNFYYLCQGDANSYGVVEYSTNNGSTWTAASANYNGQGNWTSQALTNPAFDNQAQLKFRFRWNEGASGSDPAFAVDQVLITGTGGVTASITTSTSISPTSWCFNSAQNLSVDFTSTGTFNGGNVYTAELSDASGSFASPTTIGTLSSTANTGTISATVPAGVAVGSGYRIRVVSSDPATTGSDNGANLTINALPTVTLGAFSSVCVYNDPFTLTGGSPAGGTFTGTGVTLNVFNPNTAGVGSHTITYTYNDGNCSNTAQQSISVGACAGVEELNNTFVLYPNPATTTFSLTGDKEISSVKLVDINGRLVRSYVPSENYNVNGIAPGTYYILITSGNSQEKMTIAIQ